MSIVLNIILIPFLCCSIIALPVDEDYNNDDAKDLLQFVSDASLRTKYGDMNTTSNIISLMNPEERSQGDHIPKSNDIGRSGLVNKVKLWKDGKIPYTTDKIDRNKMDVVFEAIGIIEYWTCIKFYPFVESVKALYDDYLIIHFNPNGGCKSSIGFQGGVQEVNLQYPLCFDKIGTVLHVLLHAIGLIDEHRRSERDEYVYVHEMNAEDDKKKEFSKFTEEAIDNYGIPYDYNSVMHFSEYAHSKNGRKTIEPASSNVQIGQREGMTVRDALTINNMYQCFYYLNTTEHYSDILPNANETTLTRDELQIIYFRRRLNN